MAATSPKIVFSRTTQIACPAETLFAWHERPGALERLCPPWETVRIVSASGGIRNGARVVVRQKWGPVSFRWVVEHRGYIAGREFRDAQISGPFAEWEHVHRIDPIGESTCTLTDEITYRLPGGRAGRFFGGPMVRRRLAQLFAWRHAVTKADLEQEQKLGAHPSQRVLIAGASGLVGNALIPFLTTKGYSVLRLVRRAPRSSDEVFWDPRAGELAEHAIAGVDVVINLSGENLSAGRWTAKRREEILRSRVNATQTLVNAMQRLSKRPKVFVSASAVGFYGDRHDQPVDEQSEIGRGFLPEVCSAWEDRARAAEVLGVRTVLGRFGVVLTPAGGALAKLLPVFRLGLGGSLGNGKQWMSWITIDDLLGGLFHAINTTSCTGPLNLVSPQPVTNRDFARTLGRVFGRPAWTAVPAFVLRTALGEMADEMLLSGARVLPEKLISSGYDFRQAMLDHALRHVLGKPLVDE
jgi:uncharacterized protein (TIGR01777 family)